MGDCSVFAGSYRPDQSDTKHELLKDNAICAGEKKHFDHIAASGGRKKMLVGLYRLSRPITGHFDVSVRF